VYAALRHAILNLPQASKARPETFLVILEGSMGLLGDRYIVD
jgi:hypothetical protein